MYEHLSLLIQVTKQLSTINAIEALLRGGGGGVYRYVCP